MQDRLLNWPRKPGRLAQWWYAPSVAQALLQPYHLMPRLPLVLHWLQGFQQANAQQKLGWLERLTSSCEAGAGHNASLLLTRFIKRLVQEETGFETLLDIQTLLLDSGLQPELLSVVQETFALMCHPDTLHLKAQSPNLCRLQWSRLFGATPLPDTLVQPDSDWVCWQFSHLTLKRVVLCLPMVLREERSYLQNVWFTHPGLFGLQGGGRFIHQLYLALNTRLNKPPTLCVELVVPAPSHSTNRSQLGTPSWIRTHPMLTWHLQQGAQLERIELRTDHCHCRLLYQYERISFVQSEWAMARVVRV